MPIRMKARIPAYVVLLNGLSFVRTISAWVCRTSAVQMPMA